MTTTSVRHRDRIGHPTRHGARHLTAYLAPAAALAAGVLVVVGAGATALAVALTCVAVLLARRTERGERLRVSAQLPAATTLVTAGVLVPALLAGWTGVPLLSTGWWLRGVLAAACVVLAWALRPRGEHLFPEPVPDRGALLVLAPTAWMLAVAVAIQFAPVGHRSSWVLDGDGTRHLIMVAHEVRTGGLSYSDEIYPRAWHTLMSLVWSPVGSRTTPASLADLLGDLGTATWLGATLMGLSSAVLAVALARRLGGSGRVVVVAGALTGAVLLLPFFLRPVTDQFNFLPVPLVVVALVAAALATLRLPAPGRLDVLTAGATVAVVAHTWQLLLPAAGLLAVTTAALHVRHRRVGSSGGARVVVVVLALLAPGLLLAVPPVATVITRIGVDHGAAWGHIFAFPTVGALAVVGAAVAAVVLARRTTSPTTGPGAPVVAVALAAAGTVLSGPAYAAVLGVSLSEYYPTKLSWLGVVLGLPLVVALGTVGLARVRVLGSLPGRALVVAGGLVVVAGALATPVTVATAAGSQISPAPVVAAILTPGAEVASTAYTGPQRWSNDYTDHIARTMLDYYRAPRLSELVPQEHLTVEQECAELRRSPRPTVVSDRPEAEVRARYACVPDLVVLPVSG